MILKVIEYKPPPNNFHVCEDENGNLHQVDLFIDASIEEETNESIVGKVVSVDYLHPYIEIAHGVEAK